MRIVISSLNYAPELVGVAKYSTELAEHLAGRGHDVYVVTSAPFYPQWRVHEPYRAWRYYREVRAGVNVLRCPSWVPRKPTLSRRLLHVFSYALSSAWVYRELVRVRPEVVLHVEPSLANAAASLALARRVGARSVLHVQDLEVDAAQMLLRARGVRLVDRCVAALELAVLRRFDHVTTISKPMMERLRAKGLESARLSVIPNWVDTEGVKPLGRPSLMRDELGLSAEDDVILYAGSIGKKQGLELLLGAADALSTRSHLEFVIASAGPAADELSMLARQQGLTNVRFIGQQPTERLGELLGLATVQVLVQKDEAADLVMPSKLGGMLASGVPIVATARSGTAVSDILEESGAGIAVSPGDMTQLASALVSVLEMPDKGRSMGQDGRAYAERVLSQGEAMNRFEALLQPPEETS